MNPSLPPLRLAAAAMLFLLLVAGCRKGEETPTSRTPAATPAAEVGKAAPGFALKDSSGRLWRLSALRGKLVFVNFWASWCPPCRYEMPEMEALHRSLADEEFQLVTILYNDDPETALRYVRENGFTFPVLLDPDGVAARAYGITGVPETYIVDPEGILRDKVIGPRNWNQNPQKASLRRLLPQKSPDKG